MNSDTFAGLSTLPHTLGFNTTSTATFGLSGLMALTVIIWIYLFTGLAALWYLVFNNRDQARGLGNLGLTGK